MFSLLTLNNEMSVEYVHFDMESSFPGNRGLLFFFGDGYVCFVLIMLAFSLTTLRKFITKLDQRMTTTYGSSWKLKQSF